MQSCSGSIARLPSSVAARHIIAAPRRISHVRSNVSMPPIIIAENLNKTYHVGKVEVPALRGVSFAVEQGEFVSIVGPSGSGKSTLFYVLGGLTRPDSGRIMLDGDNFTTLSDAERTRLRKRKIGFVFQKFNLLPTLSAQANIDIAVDIAGANGVRDATYF